MYELWDGKEVLGHYASPYKLAGNYLEIPEITLFEQTYNKKVKTIKIPLVVRVVKERGLDITLRIFLDVRKKSKRQIEILKQGWK